MIVIFLLFANCCIRILNADKTHCTICLMKMDGEGEKETMQLPPCKHQFHGHCILQWIQQKNNCPQCRAEVPADWKPDIEKNVVAETGPVDNIETNGNSSGNTIQTVPSNERRQTRIINGARRTYTREEKQHLMEVYREIKMESSHLTDRQIANMLCIPRSAIYRWRRI